MIPNPTLRKEFRGEIDYATDDFRILLLSDNTAFSPDRVAHEYVADVLDDGDEYDGANYSRKSLTGLSVEQNDTQNTAEWRGDKVRFDNLGSLTGPDVQAAVIYRYVTDDTDSDVIKIFDDNNRDDFPIETNGEDVELAWDARRIITRSER